MKKITCNVLVILFTLVLLPHLSLAQVKPDLDNQDSLIHYLKMDKHPEYPEASAFYVHKIIQEYNDNYDSEITLDIALKIFQIKDAEELANLILPKFTNGLKLKDLKVTTYNLENGIVQTKELDKNSLQETKLRQNNSIQLMNAAHAKNGSIVRYQLTIKGARPLYEFTFQDAIPVAYAAYELKIFKNRIIRVDKKVKFPFLEFQDTAAFNAAALPATSIVTFRNKHAIYKWVRRNVAPFKLEAFASKQTLEHLKIDFVTERIANLKRMNVVDSSALTWETYNAKLYNIYSHSFAKNDYLYKQVPLIIGAEKDSVIIARKLFKYVQDSFSLLGNSWATDFQEIIKEKKGTRAALNQLLCALYRHAGLPSDLVYVSTDRKNPFTPDKVNEAQVAVAVRVILNGVSYLCAPDQKKLPFGYLPYRYYNGYSRLINKTGGAITLDPGLAKNIYNIAVELTPIDSASNKFKIRFKKNFGFYISPDERDNYKKDSVSYKESYKKRIESITPNLSISNYTLNVENLKNIEQPFILTGEADIDLGDHSNILFLDPFLQKIYNGVNPFQTIKDRSTDVEMDFCYNLNYAFRLKLNESISVEELPAKSLLQYANPAAIKYYQNAHHDKASNTIEVTYNYDIIPVFYAPEEVADLNAFYTEIMKAANQKLLLNRK